MSAIQTFLTCQKKYDFGYVRGLKPKQSAWKMDFGTLIHEGLANIYRQGIRKAEPLLWPESAQYRIDYIQEHGIPDKETGIVRLLNLTPEQVQTARDVVNYYWEHQGQRDRFAQVVAVEEPRFLPLEGFQVRGTFDLVVKEFDQTVIYDWKTVGNVKDVADFSLDFQTLFYELLAFRVWGRPIEFVHNYIRREVPPGFGTRPVRLKKNGEPAANNASTDPVDYLRRVRHTRSEAEMIEFEQELCHTLTQMEHQDHFLRSPDKRQCPQCPYYAICGAELAGHTPLDSVLSLRYNVTQSASC